MAITEKQEILSVLHQMRNQFTVEKEYEDYFRQLMTAKEHAERLYRNVPEHFQERWEAIIQALERLQQFGLEENEAALSALNDVILAVEKTPEA